MKLSAAVTAFFYARDFSPGSAQWYESNLSRFTAWCKQHTCDLHDEPATHVEDLDTNHVREFLAYLRTSPSPAANHTTKPISSSTLHGYARCIKAWLNWCIREGLVSERVVKRLEMPKREQKVIEVFTRDHIERMFTACESAYDHKMYGWLVERDKTILAVLLDTGIRASELCGLTLANVHLDRHDSYIKVMGKGRKEREIGLGVKARTQLHRYIHRFRPNSADPHVFLTRDRQPMEPKGLAAMLERLKALTGITGVRCSAHDFRHTFAFAYLAAGGDVMKLSRLLGHTDLAVTSGYLRAFTSRDARRGSVSVLDSL